MPRWYLAALPPIIVNAIILPPMWAWAEVGAVDSAFWAACGFNVLTFIPGEALACYVLGTLLLFALPKVPALRHHLGLSLDLLSLRLSFILSLQFF